MTRLTRTETFFNKADGELVCVTRDNGAGYYVLYCTGPLSFVEDRFSDELEYFIPNDLVALEYLEIHEPKIGTNIDEEA